MFFDLKSMNCLIVFESLTIFTLNRIYIYKVKNKYRVLNQKTFLGKSKFYYDKKSLSLKKFKYQTRQELLMLSFIFTAFFRNSFIIYFGRYTLPKYSN